MSSRWRIRRGVGRGRLVGVFVAVGVSRRRVRRGAVSVGVFVAVAVSVGVLVAVGVSVGVFVAGACWCLGPWRIGCGRRLGRRVVAVGCLGWRVVPSGSLACSSRLPSWRMPSAVGVSVRGRIRRRRSVGVPSGWRDSSTVGVSVGTSVIVGVGVSVGVLVGVFVSGVRRRRLCPSACGSPSVKSVQPPAASMMILNGE